MDAQPMHEWAELLDAEAPGVASLELELQIARPGPGVAWIVTR
jgi:hypothetical protein